MTNESGVDYVTNLTDRYKYFDFRPILSETGFIEIKDKIINKRRNNNTINQVICE